MRIHNLISSLTALLVSVAFIVGAGATSAFARKTNDPAGTLNTRVEYRLAKDLILPHKIMCVVVGKKDIVLSGTVRTLFQKEEAAKLARKMAHGYAVVNDLKISSPNVADTLIEAKVLQRIQTRVPYTVLDWAMVNSHNGIVTLTGWVHNMKYLKEYQRQAERVVGVKKVVNRLRYVFRYRRLAWRAVRLIYRDGDLFPGSLLRFNPPIHVIAVEGTVVLEGKTRDSGFAALLANRVRYHTNAIRVYNEIKTRA